MRALFSGLFAGLAVALVALPAGAATMFVANLEAAQEVDPTSTALGFGVASLQLTLNTDNQLAFAIVVNPTFDFTGFGGGGGGETVVGLHFHNAPRGANGPVVFGVINPASDTDGDTAFSNLGLAGTRVDGEWDSGEGNNADLDDFIAELLAAQPGDEVDLYINLHTTNFPAGAIRGQLVAVPEPSLVALLAVGLAGLAIGRGRRGTGC